MRFDVDLDERKRLGRKKVVWVVVGDEGKEVFMCVMSTCGSCTSGGFGLDEVSSWESASNRTGRPSGPVLALDLK
jgi:hypothetical protein